VFTASLKFEQLQLFYVF